MPVFALSMRFLSVFVSFLNVESVFAKTRKKQPVNPLLLGIYLLILRFWAEFPQSRVIAAVGFTKRSQNFYLLKI